MEESEVGGGEATASKRCIYTGSKCRDSAFGGSTSVFVANIALPWFYELQQGSARLLLQMQRARTL